jgi:hypothetical protein
MIPIREPNFSKKGKSYKFDGRYRAKNGKLVAVHEGIGHTIASFAVDGLMDYDYIAYDHNGDCSDRDLQNQGYYLVERINPQSVEAGIKVEGCERCK